MSKFQRIRINLSVRWRFFKEKIIEIFVCRNKHLPTLLMDEETIVCDRCGKVLGKVQGKFVEQSFKSQRSRKAVHQDVGKFFNTF